MSLCLGGSLLFADDSVLLAPPPHEGPLAVEAVFELLSISHIDDEAEKVTFSGVLTLTWRDPRQAFDPAAAGVSEKFYSGAYQFNELAPAWYPQVTLVNASGQYDSRAVLLRVQPDGTTILNQEIEAVAKVTLDMRRFPLDSHRFDVVFRIFGFDAHEVAFHAEPASALAGGALEEVPQWTLRGISASTGTMNAGGDGAADASTFLVTMDVRRQPLFMVRLVVIPQALIVILSWSVFWMDRSSVGDRMAVSFVGILTAVAYQITLVGIVPNVSYFTLMNGFLNLSFLIMSATVVINLYVGALDRRGHERGDRVDRRCRWLFPLVHFGMIAFMLTVTQVVF